MRLAPLQRAEMDANHRAATTAARAAKDPIRKNVPVVLNLGELQYIHFRGRAYGVPPVPWKAGQRLQAACLEAEQYPAKLSLANAPQYHALIETLPNMLWSLMRPLGMVRRLLWRAGLLPNPLRQATEAELLVLARFFLQSRMKSHVGLGIRAPAPPSRMR